MLNHLKVFVLLLSVFPLVSQAVSTGAVTVEEHWVGPSSYDRVFVDADISSLGGGCINTKSFAIKTDDPNYKAMNAMILAALVSGKKIKLYGPGEECLGNGKYPVANRVSLVK